MRTKYHVINSGSNGYTLDENPLFNQEMDVLNITHNAGFFSCCTIALQDTMIWFNLNRRMPDKVDRSHQYAYYKSEPLQNLIAHFFAETDDAIPFERPVVLTHGKQELQYTDYRQLDFNDVKPFLDKFFRPSEYVLSIVKMYEEKYNIDYENTCAVFYRGNDKNRETKIAPYQMFIDKAKEVYDNMYLPFGNDNLRFLIQPDETEFLGVCYEQLPNCFHFEETPHISKQDSAVPFEMPVIERANYAANFLAAVICLSKCKHLVGHSGNCMMWAVLYRGNTDNVHQIKDNVWL